jgi:hypothetical protein
VLHEDEVHDVAATANENANYLASVLTITLCGLPEMILTINEVIKSLACSFANSKVTGNGALTGVPDEWSLMCHTVPYSLVLVPQGSEEWNKVVTLGKYDPCPPPLFLPVS